MTGWINGMSVMEPRDVGSFTGILEREVSSLDVTYRVEDHLGVVLHTDEDVALFRIALLGQSTIGDIHAVGERSYVMPLRLSEEVRHWMGVGLFDGAAAPLTVACLELRNQGVLRRLDDALDAERLSFAGSRPELILA